jgi:hypothetical protein
LPRPARLSGSHVVRANAPPVCGLARPSPADLLPPNHKLVRVGIVGITDPDDCSDDGDDDDDNGLSITITGVTQDEPVNRLGDGDTSPDAVVTGSTALLRAERPADSSSPPMVRARRRG